MVTLLHLGLGLAGEESYRILQGLKPRHHKSLYSAQLNLSRLNENSKPLGREDAFEESCVFSAMLFNEGLSGATKLQT